MYHPLATSVPLSIHTLAASLRPRTIDDRIARRRSCRPHRLSTPHHILPRVYSRRCYPGHWTEHARRSGRVPLPSRVTSSRVTHLSLLIPTSCRREHRPTAPPPAQHRHQHPPRMAFSAAISRLEPLRRSMENGAARTTTTGRLRRRTSKPGGAPAAAPTLWMRQSTVPPSSTRSPLVRLHPPEIGDTTRAG